MSIRRLSALGTALGLIAAGLVAGSTAGTAAAALGDGDNAAVDVFIQRNHVVRMDTTLRPGLQKFVVRSARGASLQLLQPAAGYTKAQATRDIARALGRGNMTALVRFESNVTLVAGISSDAEKPGVMWADLEPGTYWAIDTWDETPTAAETLTVRVSGVERTTSVTRGPTIRAVNEVDWAARPKRIPARGRLTFRNDSTDNHHLIMVKLATGKTMADFRAWVDSGMESAPPVNESVGGFDTGVISSGKEMTARYRLRPGRYVMVCFWPDSDMDGMPHIAMGMYRGIRVG